MKKSQTERHSPGRLLLMATLFLGMIAAPASAATNPPPGSSATPAKESTPREIKGSEPHVFRAMGEVELRLHVVKPADWDQTQHRACLVSYFGGGWNSGTPESSIAWARWAAELGLVGVAPDYRTRNRFASTPEDCIADGRAAFRWVILHAAELGIDPQKIVALGSSAGGHVAAWTAIPAHGPGPDDPPPPFRPAALILVNPVTDTKEGGYGGPKRFGDSAPRALACSVPDQMSRNMPPTLVFHATADLTVPYANSVFFRDRMVANGNRCELVTFQGLGHTYSSSKLWGEEGRKAEQRTKAEALNFLRSLSLIGSIGGHP